MTRSRFLPLAACLLLMLFLSLHVMARTGLARVWLDSSQDQASTLSPGTHKILADLKQPIEVRLYLSRQALTADPVLRSHGEQVRALLKNYQISSNGLIDVVEIDPVAFSAAEDEALAAGMTPIPGPNPDDAPAYLGLSLKTISGRSQTLPLLAPDEAGDLEYQLGRALVHFEQGEPTRIALITGLPWLVTSEPGKPGLRPVARLMASLMDGTILTRLGPDFAAIPPRTDVLVIAQPEPLSLAQQFAIDQYVLAGGKLLLLLDPASTIAQDGGGGPRTASQALGPLPQAWGFSVQGDVIADRGFALPVQTGLSGRAAVAPQPLVFRVPSSGLDHTDPITANLTRGLHVATAGQVVDLEQAGSRFIPLMTTSPDTMRLDPARALSGPSPQDIALDWQSSGEAQIIGAKISGSWTTAFPGGTPTGQSGAFLRSSVKPGEIIVIGDVDLLADSLYLNAQGEIADNARLILNSLDALRGQTTLLSIRNKTARPRPLVVVEKLRQTAQTRILEEQQALESRLSLAEARLADMEARSVASGVLPQGPTTGDIADARQEVQTTRSRLRAVQDGARRDVAAIKNGLIGVCAVAIPMLILLVGLIGQLKWRRMEARRVP